MEVHVDNDVTAADRRNKRKDYIRMQEDVQSGHIDAVISWHPDRLYRQPAELEDLIIIVEEHKTEIATVKAGDLDLSPPRAGSLPGCSVPPPSTRWSTSRSASSARSRSWRRPGRFTTPVTGPSVTPASSTARARAGRSWARS